MACLAAAISCSIVVSSGGGGDGLDKSLVGTHSNGEDSEGSDFLGRRTGKLLVLATDMTVGINLLRTLSGCLQISAACELWTLLVIIQDGSRRG